MEPRREGPTRGRRARRRDRAAEPTPTAEVHGFPPPPCSIFETVLSDHPNQLDVTVPGSAQVIRLGRGWKTPEGRIWDRKSKVGDKDAIQLGVAIPLRAINGGNELRLLGLALESIAITAVKNESPLVVIIPDNDLVPEFTSILTRCQCIVLVDAPKRHHDTLGPAVSTLGNAQLAPRGDWDWTQAAPGAVQRGIGQGTSSDFVIITAIVFPPKKDNEKGKQELILNPSKEPVTEPANITPPGQQLGIPREFQTIIETALNPLTQAIRDIGTQTRGGMDEIGTILHLSMNAMSEMIALAHNEAILGAETLIEQATQPLMIAIQQLQEASRQQEAQLLVLQLRQQVTTLTQQRERLQEQRAQQVSRAIAYPDRLKPGHPKRARALAQDIQRLTAITNTFLTEEVTTLHLAGIHQSLATIGDTVSGQAATLELTINLPITLQQTLDAIEQEEHAILELGNIINSYPAVIKDSKARQQRIVQLTHRLGVIRTQRSRIQSQLFEGE